MFLRRIFFMRAQIRRFTVDWFDSSASPLIILESALNQDKIEVPIQQNNRYDYLVLGGEESYTFTVYCNSPA